MDKNSIVLHRIFATPAEKAFKAFTDADEVASLPPMALFAECTAWMQ